MVVLTQYICEGSSVTIAFRRVNNKYFPSGVNEGAISHEAVLMQNALRTDGYTTWIDGNVTNAYPVDSFSVSAWMAPEVYPVDMAAVWSYFDQPTNKGGLFIP